jgi:hydroxylaminobenzene mutase
MTQRASGKMMNLSLIRHGFVVMLLGLVGGFFIPAMTIPRLAVSAHTIAILGGVLLIALGIMWREFALSERQRVVLHWCWLYSSYVNWLGCLVGAMTGAGRVTPVASAGATGPPAAEAAVGLLLGSVGIVSLVAVGLALWGLRRASVRVP